MYDYISGTLVEITPAYIVIDVAGIGYKIYAANPFQFAAYRDQALKVYVYHAVREDAEMLYGFDTVAKRQLFEQLLKVSGIGPKSALAIMATDDHNGLINAIESSDITYLTNFPGVGKKTAQQIIIDLQGKLDEIVLFQDELWDLAPEKYTKVEENQVVSEAKEALLALGYSQREINKVEKKLQGENIQTTDEYLRQALKAMMK